MLLFLYLCFDADSYSEAGVTDYFFRPPAA